jgi:hypothetical protein
MEITPSPTDEVIRFGFKDDQIEVASVKEVEKVTALLRESVIRTIHTDGEARFKFWQELYRYRYLVPEIEKLQMDEWKEAKKMVTNILVSRSLSGLEGWTAQVLREIGIFSFDNPPPKEMIARINSLALLESGSALVEASKNEDHRNAERKARERLRLEVGKEIAKISASELLALSPEERFNLLFRVPASDTPIPSSFQERKNIWRPLQLAFEASYGPVANITWPTEEELVQTIYRAMEATTSLGAPNSSAYTIKRFSAHLTALLFPAAVKETLRALNGFQLDDSFDRIWIEEYPALAPR